MYWWCLIGPVVQDTMKLLLQLFKKKNSSETLSRECSVISFLVQ